MEAQHTQWKKFKKIEFRVNSQIWDDGTSQFNLTPTIFFKKYGIGTCYKWSVHFSFLFWSFGFAKQQ